MQQLKIDPVVYSQPLTDNSQDLRRKKERQALILRSQRAIFSAWRTDQYPDPDGYMVSLGAVLEQYPDEVVLYVSDPRTGVQRASKWPPTISEIVSALDTRVSELARKKRFENWGKNETQLIEPPRGDRLSLDELKAKYGENWGLTSLDKQATSPSWKRAPTWDEIGEMYQGTPGLIARLVKPKE